MENKILLLLTENYDKSSFIKWIRDEFGSDLNITTDKLHFSECKTLKINMVEGCKMPKPDIKKHLQCPLLDHLRSEIIYNNSINHILLYLYQYHQNNNIKSRFVLSISKINRISLCPNTLLRVVYIYSLVNIVSTLNYKEYKTLLFNIVYMSRGNKFLVYITVKRYKKTICLYWKKINEKVLVLLLKEVLRVKLTISSGGVSLTDYQDEL